jgi:hypothetical protein
VALVAVEDSLPAAEAAEVEAAEVVSKKNSLYCFFLFIV